MNEKAKQSLSVRLIESLRGMLGFRFPPIGPLANKAVFKILPQECFVELLPDIHIEAHFDDLTYRSTYWQGKRFEGGSLDVLLGWMKDDASCVFFDIGSNYGFFSLQIHHHRKNVIIHAFEPNPRTHHRLETIKRQNNLVRLYTHPFGMSDESGELVLHHGSDDLGHSTFGAHPDLKDTFTSRATVHVFDAWAARAQADGNLEAHREWVAKIDVEGFEPRVLRGMTNCLAARKFRGLMVEVNPFTLRFNGFSSCDISHAITKHGYRPLFNGDAGPGGNQFFERE